MRDDGRAVLDRDWVRDARRQRHRHKQLRLVVAGTCEIAAPTVPRAEVVRDAAAAEPPSWATRSQALTHSHQRRAEFYPISARSDTTSS